MSSLFSLTIIFLTYVVVLSLLPLLQVVLLCLEPHDDLPELTGLRLQLVRLHPCQSIDPFSYPCQSIPSAVPSPSLPINKSIHLPLSINSFSWSISIPANQLIHSVTLVNQFLQLVRLHPCQSFDPFSYPCQSIPSAGSSPSLPII